MHRKLVAALNELEKHGVDHPTAGHVVRALFQRPSDDFFPAPPPPNKTSLQNHSSSSSSSRSCGLDDSQLEAIDFCLQNQRPVALIHGPPGTSLAR